MKIYWQNYIGGTWVLGLFCGVFTRHLDRATTAARQLRAGQVFVNEWYAGGVETPFGGYGKSGYGRESALRQQRFKRRSDGILPIGGSVGAVFPA